MFILSSVTLGKNPVLDLILSLVICYTRGITHITIVGTSASALRKLLSPIRRLTI